MKLEELVLKEEKPEVEVINKKGKLKEDEDDDIDTEKTLEKSYKEIEKNVKNAEFIEGVNEVGCVTFLFIKI